MRSLVVFIVVLALSVAAPHDDSVLKKRSVGHGYVYPVSSLVTEPVVEARAVYDSPAAVYAPASVYSSGSAVSHQSRVDVHSSPAIFEAAPIVEARSLYLAPLYAAPAAVSHQSRYDVRSPPAVVSQQLVAPAVFNQHLLSTPAVVDARSIWSPSLYAASW